MPAIRRRAARRSRSSPMSCGTAPGGRVLAAGEHARLELVLAGACPRRRRRGRRGCPRGRRRPRRGGCRGRGARRRRRRRSRPAARRRRPPRGRPGGGRARRRSARSSSRAGSRGRRPGAGRPRPLVMPASNQHIEPALRPGEHDPGLPRLAQDRVEPVGAPQREQVDHRAAADVDDVLGEQVLAQRHRALAEPEQRDHAGLAQAVAERDRGSGGSAPRSRRPRSAAGRCAARARARARARSRPAPTSRPPC